MDINQEHGYHMISNKNSSLRRLCDPNHKIHPHMRCPCFSNNNYYFWSSMQYYCISAFDRMIFGIPPNSVSVLSHSKVANLLPRKVYFQDHTLTMKLKILFKMWFCVAWLHNNNIFCFCQHLKVNFYPLPFWTVSSISVAWPADENAIVSSVRIAWSKSCKHKNRVAIN